MNPGIAIITYKRPKNLLHCIQKIKEFTKSRYDLIVVSDTFDDDESAKICIDQNIGFIHGHNRGVVWNKNRALHYFLTRTSCDPIIIVEDDVYPLNDRWIDDWVVATRKWDHVNFSHPALFQNGQPAFEGDGTPLQPHFHHLVTGQCTGVTRKAIRIGGYLDTRFRGYGHGHVEWTHRHSELVYKHVLPTGRPDVRFISIHGNIASDNATTFRNEEDVARNQRLLHEILRLPPTYQEPWKDADDHRVLEAEIGNFTEALPFEKKVDAQAVRPSGAGSLKDLVKGKMSAKMPTGRGSIDSVQAYGLKLVFSGWAMSPTQKLSEAIIIELNGTKFLFDHFTKTERPDVVAAYPGCPSNVGFEVEIPAAQIPSGMSKNSDIAVFAKFKENPVDLKLPPSKIFSFPSDNYRLDVSDFLRKFHKKNLYFGNLPRDEEQYKSGEFIGLAIRIIDDRDVLQNAYDPIPVPDSSVSKVQSQDVFEHLEYDRVPAVLDEIYRVLKSGGIFRMSLPDYRSPLLKARSVYDETGQIIADLMMGMSVRYDATTKSRRVDILKNGDSHLWFPNFDNVRSLIDRSLLKRSSSINFHHVWTDNDKFECNPYADEGMPVKRAPPGDMRADGKPISIIVDFVK